MVIVKLGFSQTESNANSSAKVVIYRPDQEFFLLNVAIFANGKKICKLSNTRYLIYTASLGKLNINAHRGGYEFMKKETQLTLEVEADKTYYVLCNVKKTYIPNHHISYFEVEMFEVPETLAKIDLAKLKPDHCMTESFK